MAGQSQTVEVRIPRGSGLERVAGLAALSLASRAGFPYSDAKDLELAVCEACEGLAGRFEDGVCEHVVVSLCLCPDALEVVAFGDGERLSGGGASTPLNSDQMDLCLSLLRGLMDRVTVADRGEHGLSVAMAKRRC